MKKMIMMMALVATGFVAKAATVDWSLTATAAEENYTVLVFASAVEANYETYADLAANAIGSDTIKGYTSRGATTYRTAAKVSAEADGLGNSLYVVLVADSTASTFKYATIDITGKTYDPAAQETSPGLVSMSSANIASAGTIGGGNVPEPTTGLLVLLGMAGLALKRKLA